MISACLSFDSRFSIEGWLCYQSIRKFNPFRRIYVFCFDERVFLEAEYFQHTDGEVIPIRLFQLENYFPQLLKCRATRDWPAYTQTCKSFFPSFLYQKYKELKGFYVDSDMFFWGDPKRIEEELDSDCFLVAPREQVPRPPQGSFNGGFFAWYYSTELMPFLFWWQDSCIDWCFWRPGEGGRFTEEGYFNIIEDDPERFKGLKVSKNPGINLAWWNVNKHDLALIDNNQIRINSLHELICYHYQGANLETKEVPNLRQEGAKLLYQLYYQAYSSFREKYINEIFPNLRLR